MLTHVVIYRAVFVPTQIINFAFVPHHLRVLTIGVVSLFWSASSSLIKLSSCRLTLCPWIDTYLSMVNNGTKQVVEHEEHIDEKSVALASDVD